MITHLRMSFPFWVFVFSCTLYVAQTDQGWALQARDAAELAEHCRALRNDGRLDEALALLDSALVHLPHSFELGREKYFTLRAAKRFEECLDFVNASLQSAPAEAKPELLQAKRRVLIDLLHSELSRSDTAQAFRYLAALADAGYRGSHDFRYDREYAPLRAMPGFQALLGQIARNAGIGSPPPDFSTWLRNGELFTLTGHKGKVLLVDFWSTYCGPCIEEMPRLRDLHAEYAGAGFEIVSISVDTDEQRLDRFLLEQPMPWATVYSGKGWGDDVARLYAVAWVPSYWLVDRNGILRFFDVRGEDLSSAVAELVGEN